MGNWIIACKELNGNIYLTRIAQAIDDHTPGVPDVWRFVGPGTRPSVQEYNGNQFILTFDYLSHLFCRVVDVNTWPPTQVNPVQISGGPNPPTPFTYAIQLAQDSLTIKTEGATNLGVNAVAAFFNPPILAQPLVFSDPLSNTYSTTLVTAAGYAPQVPAGQTAFYRLYRRTFTPSIGPWTMIMDWTPSPLSFQDSNTGSLRFQYSATWGSGFDPTQPFNAAAHAEGIVGQTFITVDSTIGNLNFQFFLNESLTLDRSSTSAFGDFGPNEAFIDEAADDAIQLSKSSLGKGDNTFSFFDTRQAFVNEAVVDALLFSQSALQGNALQAVMG